MSSVLDSILFRNFRNFACEAVAMLNVSGHGPGTQERCDLREDLRTSAAPHWHQSLPCSIMLHVPLCAWQGNRPGTVSKPCTLTCEGGCLCQLRGIGWQHPTAQIEKGTPCRTRVQLFCRFWASARVLSCGQSAYFARRPEPCSHGQAHWLMGCGSSSGPPCKDPVRPFDAASWGYHRDERAQTMQVALLLQVS